MEILNKRVVVTGAASGIGKALAVEFKNEQAKDVVLADLNEDVLKVAEELGYAGFVLNVSKEDEIQKLIAFANEKMNGIDIFCSNAGIGGAFGLLDVTTEDWQNIWDVNFMAHAHVAKHLIPQMLEQGSG
ncbi:MAG: SDR family NAD(P)-dependent oxidoreductase, partial [Gammaproteobacteria bacterium]